jgi:hypothetical protein
MNADGNLIGIRHQLERVLATSTSTDDSGVPPVRCRPVVEYVVPSS